MTLYLVLEGKVDPDKVPHLTSKRIVAFNTDDIGDVKLCYSPSEGKNFWGLGNEKDGWWRIIDAYECIEPTDELHENKFPVAFHLSEEEFSDIVKEANNG